MARGCYQRSQEGCLARGRPGSSTLQVWRVLSSDVTIASMGSYGQ